MDGATTSELQLSVPGGQVVGDLVVPVPVSGVVVFAHGSGSSRHSQRNRAVAAALQTAGYATLLLDLLTAEEEVRERRGERLRFDVARLAARVLLAVDLLVDDPGAVGLPGGASVDTDASAPTDGAAPPPLPLALFGASTGAAAALVAAAERPGRVAAVVSRGGRPDLAGTALASVRAPTLLIVGANDTTVLTLNRRAQAALGGPAELAVVADAGHLFEEPGALAEVAVLAVEHLRRWLPPR